MQFIQTTHQAIDVTDWQKVEEFAPYPEGARDKTLLYCPSSTYRFLKNDSRYLFKRSSSRYPEQFWVEIFAYLLGRQMDILIPPTFVAYDSKEKQSGALIEWFLNPHENYIPGGDYCKQYIPDFDRKKGQQHNFETISLIFEDLNKKYPNSKIDWKNFWAKTFTFDALIGNTDRHQDNWGIITNSSNSQDISNEKIRISPVFDNGTSMGHEIFSNKFKYYENQNHLKKYTSKGFHHMKWNINDIQPAQHVEILQKLIAKHPETHKSVVDCLKNVNYNIFKSIRNMLVSFDILVKLSVERADFMLNLLEVRHQNLLRAVEK